MNNNLIERKINHLKEGGYNKIVRMAENYLLRANDLKLLMSEEQFNSRKKALETILEDYKEDEIYNYYYNLNKVSHSFCTFERWKKGMLF